MPKIDQLVDATIGYQTVSFLDAYNGYNQISIYLEDEEKKGHLEDEEKISFKTLRGLFCYKVMPFQLKNVGSTYQSLVTKIFAGLLENIVEAY